MAFGISFTLMHIAWIRLPRPGFSVLARSSATLIPSWSSNGLTGSGNLYREARYGFISNTGGELESGLLSLLSPLSGLSRGGMPSLIYLIHLTRLISL